MSRRRRVPRRTPVARRTPARLRGHDAQDGRRGGRRGRAGLRFRKRLHVLPGVWANASRRGLSWTLRLGPWSWNSRTRAYRMDLPGPLSWQGRSGRSPLLILAGLAVPVAALTVALAWWVVIR